MQSLLVAVTLVGGLSLASEDQGRLRPLGGNSLASKPLFTEDDLTYVGGFLTASDANNEASGKALAFYQDPTYGPSLYMQTSFAFGNPTPTQTGYVLQMEVPDGALGTGSDTTAYPRATLIQASHDVYDGNLAELTSGNPALAEFNQVRQWGLLVYGNRLIGTAFFFYDGDGAQRVSHFAHGLTLSGADSFEGFDAVWDAVKSRYVSGPMAVVPTYAQAALGGPVITTGAGYASIISHLSGGAAAFAFDPTGISGRTETTVSAQPLMWFEGSTSATFQRPHARDNPDGPCPEPSGPCPEISNEDDPNTEWNTTTAYGGVVIPEGYRTLLYFGGHGDGDWCYGPPTATALLHATISTSSHGDGTAYPWCYDPTDGTSQGDHGFPYVYRVWAYDLNDLAAVKAGTKSHDAVHPYATWTLTFPHTPAITEPALRLGGVAYDAATKAIYVVQLAATEGDDYTVKRPVIQKFTHQ